MSKPKNKNPRPGLLASIFAKANRLGISSDVMREEIAPSVIGRRLSEASTKELYQMVEHLAGLSSRRSSEGQRKEKRYPSSRAGLFQELKDVARKRWGDDFEAPLNAFLNHNRKAETDYRFLNVTAMKAVKERIKKLNAKDVV